MAKKTEYIEIQGAAEHNLKHVSVKIPKFKLVVFTGPSGSGKSSLAFDTIYAEGQRRYVESLSSYARQFLGQMDKPKYDHIRGLSPTISIDQKAASNNPRSTVGTITEVHDYLRVLYARIGRQHCYQCGRPVETLSAQEMTDRIMRLPQDTRFMLLTRLVDNRKGEYRVMLQDAVKEGYGRFRINGTIHDRNELPILDKKKKHTIDIIIDRLVVPAEINASFRARLTDSVETSLKKGKGLLICSITGGDERLYSAHRYCPYCDLSFPDLSPQSFSFNSPLGMCPDCHGIGTKPEMDPELVIPDPTLSVREGAVEPWAKVIGRSESWTGSLIHNFAKDVGIDLDKPWNKLPKSHRDFLLYGSKDRKISMTMHFSSGKLEWARSFEGVLNELYRRFGQTKSEGMRKYYMKYLSNKECSTCKGRRLRPESEAVSINSISLPDFSAMTIEEAINFLGSLPLNRTETQISEELLKEIKGRLGFLVNVGLGYLMLDRSGPSLSGGESQRIRLASQIGSELSGVLYILDEPSIGLHQRDNRRLLTTLKRLRDFGNTVIVVEHDEETILTADHVIDFGPGAGTTGGKIVFSGTSGRLKKSRDSLTGRYLSGRLAIETPQTRRPGSGKNLSIRKAGMNNLKKINVDFPLETFIAVTGVSGAGKSTLLNGTLYPALRNQLYGSKDSVGAFKDLKGVAYIDKVINIDQRPIGRTPRSNPATYTKIFDAIRQMFAMSAEAKTYGFKPGRFSFNVKGGRCETCQGEGVRRIEMHFLADVFVPCEVCKGKRFNEATLRVRFKGLNIADVLDLTVNEAREIFTHIPNVMAGLNTLADVGLGYLKLGQPSPTLSGGEAQRIKLARELSRAATGRTLYFLDEPTTGLHFHDIKNLLHVLNRLVDNGNTVIVIEHNLDVIRAADHIIDIGPEGGNKGGYVMAAGTPEEIVSSDKGYTADYLRSHLEK